LAGESTIMSERELERENERLRKEVELLWRKVDELLEERLEDYSVERMSKYADN
jgi:hypothetical protein